MQALLGSPVALERQSWRDMDECAAALAAVCRHAQQLRGRLEDHVAREVECPVQ